MVGVPGRVFFLGCYNSSYPGEFFVLLCFVFVFLFCFFIFCLFVCLFVFVFQTLGIATKIRVHGSRVIAKTR